MEYDIDRFESGLELNNRIKSRNKINSKMRSDKLGKPESGQVAYVAEPAGPAVGADSTSVPSSLKCSV